MKTNVLYIYDNMSAEFFLEWQIFGTKFVEKIRTHILCSITSVLKSCHLWDNVQNYGTAREIKGDSKIRRMRNACWITKATDTHSVYTYNVYCFPTPIYLCQWASICALTILLPGGISRVPSSTQEGFTSIDSCPSRSWYTYFRFRDDED
jgi:hypothetical protein